ncbi:cytochrome P450 71B37-like [Primulina tabacum]|uniref:cytochrome P450 71B37-like n=1 Tax=Primulina tabacum TaxID=48773 RepID=UPI003F5AB004
MHHRRIYTIPPKTFSHVIAWAISRDPEYWKNADEFLPERFMNSSVDVMGKILRSSSFGPGISIGLAMAEHALANLVCFFDWELPEGIESDDIDPESSPGLNA